MISENVILLAIFCGVVFLWMIVCVEEKFRKNEKMERINTKKKDSFFWVSFLFLGICIFTLGGIEIVQKTWQQWFAEPDEVVFTPEPLFGPLTLGSLDKDLILSGVLVTVGYPVTIRAKCLIIDDEQGLIVTSHAQTSQITPPRPEQGPDGKDGFDGRGEQGANGQAGRVGIVGIPGKSAGEIRIEVAEVLKGHLTLENFGLPGHPGGDGGKGGKGGDGGQGQSSLSIDGDCQRGAGRGGDGGRGGDAGLGGEGGEGGEGGMVIISYRRFTSGSLTINTRGGAGGMGGQPGTPGKGGQPGLEGKLSENCVAANQVGNEGASGDAASAGAIGPQGDDGAITIVHKRSSKQIWEIQVLGSLSVDPQTIKKRNWGRKDVVLRQHVPADGDPHQ